MASLLVQLSQTGATAVRWSAGRTAWTTALRNWIHADLTHGPSLARSRVGCHRRFSLARKNNPVLINDPVSGPRRAGSAWSGAAVPECCAVKRLVEQTSTPLIVPAPMPWRVRRTPSKQVMPDELQAAQADHPCSSTKGAHHRCRPGQRRGRLDVAQRQCNSNDGAWQ